MLDNWNKGELNSFLVEITSNILKFKDSDGGYLVEKIRDTAGQKGTGKWTAISALDSGVPVTLIGESVFARFVHFFSTFSSIFTIKTQWYMCIYA